MFTVDESPAHVTTTPAAKSHLRALAAAQGGVTVLLTDDRARVLPQGQAAPAGAVHLGRIGDAVTFAGDANSHTAWWRNRAVIDLTDSARGITYALAPLTEAEVYAAVASGPLPRY